MASDPYKYFRIESRELVDQLGSGILELEKGGRAPVIQRLLRLAHTLKGAARVVRLPEIAEHAHAIEEALAPYRDSVVDVPAACTQTLFTLVDAIASCVGRLDAPQGSPEPASSTEIQASRVAVRPDLPEMDALLDGIFETHARLGALRTSRAMLDEARHLTELLSAQLAPRPRAALTLDDARAVLHQLRDRVAQFGRTFDAELDHLSRELFQVRDTAEQLRLVPVGTVFTSLERTVRDIAQELGKSVTFDGRGGDVRVDAHVLASVQGALVQLARNAVAHGIESPAARRAAGKPASGRVTVEVARRGRRVVFACIDDGRGLDLEAVRAVAVARGMAVASKDAGEIVRVLLRGGITTAATVTPVAGRGIGLDVVREVTDRLGGEVTVQTGTHGTRFELMLPLSLASVEAVLVESGGIAAAVPLAAVRCALRIASATISRTARGESVILDGEALPFLRLASALRADDVRRRPSWLALVIEVEERRAMIGVEQISSTASIIIRPLPRLAVADPVVAGAALDADGNARLVIDPERLLALSCTDRAIDDDPDPVRHSVLVIDDSLTTRMLEQSILESAGYDVDTAASGEQGLEAARRKRYALFLVDVEMPGIDGFTFIERTQADPHLRQTPAILVTSRASAEDKRRGDEVGARGYIVKGEFDQVALLARIARMVQ